MNQYDVEKDISGETKSNLLVIQLINFKFYRPNKWFSCFASFIR